MQIATVYKTASCSFQNFQQYANDHLLPHIDISKPFFILGDFNSNIQQDLRIQNFISTTFKCNQKVVRPTTNSNTTIDLVFSNCDTTMCEPIYCAWSDHKTINVVL